MPYKSLEDRRRAWRESKARQRRSSPGGIVKGGSTPDVHPVVYRNVHPWERIPLSDMQPWERRQAVRRATMVTMGLTQAAYEWHLEERVASLEALTSSLSEHIIQLSWAIAELQADAIGAAASEETMEPTTAPLAVPAVVSEGVQT